MTISGYSDSLDCVTSIGVHIKSDNYYTSDLK